MVRSIDAFERFASRLVLDNGRPMRLEGFQRRMLGDYFRGCRESITCIAKGAGKTTLLAALGLFELLSDPDCSGAVCAASRDQAALLLGQLSGFVERSPGLAARVRLQQRQAINRRTGGRFRVLASDVDTMDGLILSFAVADEIHRWRDSERYMILLAAVQKRDGRMFGISTAGIAGEGLLWQMREKALELGARREGAYLGLQTDGFSWHEWSLPEDADFRDIAQVKGCNPGSWVTEAMLRERFESPSMIDVDYRRFSCNAWVERRELASVFDTATWRGLVDTHAQPLPPFAFAADASMDRSSAAIAVCGYLDQEGERPLVDVTDFGAGTGWVVERLVDLCERHENVGVVIDPGGPAASLIPRVQEFGLEVIEISTREVAMACGGFYDAVSNGTLRHRGAAPLDTSVAGAVKRSLAQSWALDRKKSLADPSPVMAAVLAHFGLLTRGPISQAALDQLTGGPVT
jgi:hypothetical protein